MLKRFAAACAVATIVAGPMSATAGDGPIAGSILIGHPLTGVTGGVTEIAGACDPASPFQGVDGHWVQLAGQTQADLVQTANADISDLDIYFYTAECGFVAGASLATDAIGGGESGPIPAEAGYLIVDAFIGAGAGFDLTLS